LAGVVHAVPRAGTGRLGTKDVSDTAIHPDWSCGGRVLFAPIRFIFAENSFSFNFSSSLRRHQRISTSRHTAYNTPYYTYFHRLGVWSLVGKRANRMLFHKMM
jgi:hypothetical protein